MYTLDPEDKEHPSIGFKKIWFAEGNPNDFISASAFCRCTHLYYIINRLSYMGFYQEKEISNVWKVWVISQLN